MSWRDHELETNKDVNNKTQIHTSRDWFSLGNSKLLYHPGRHKAPQCAKILNKSLKEYMFNLYWILRIFMFWYLGCRDERERVQGLKALDLYMLVLVWSPVPHVSLNFEPDLTSKSHWVRLQKKTNKNQCSSARRSQRTAWFLGRVLDLIYFLGNLDSKGCGGTQVNLWLWTRVWRKFQ